MKKFVKRTWIFSCFMFLPTVSGLPTHENIDLIYLAIEQLNENPVDRRLAEMIDYHSKANGIDPLLMVALMKVESTFRQNAVSSSGDVSIAQINYQIWKPEFARHGIDLDYHRLKHDPNYAIGKMAQILKILKDRYEHRDPHWYGRYHSKTRKYKTLYLKKVNLELNKISTVLSI